MTKPSARAATFNSSSADTKIAGGRLLTTQSALTAQPAGHVANLLKAPQSPSQIRI